MGRIIVTIVAAVLMSSICVSQSQATSQAVPVSIPGFKVIINGIECGADAFPGAARAGLPSEEQYPLLLYKSITYVPMTYFKSNLLNLNTAWDAEEGLRIEAGDAERWKVFEYELAFSKNRINQTAAIVSFPVTVNGKKIDNAREPYPLLLFRDITYFPLTWRFAAEEFGWDYHYSAETGLAITADNSYFYYHHGVEGAGYKSGQAAVYIHNGLKIWMESHMSRLTASGNLYISREGAVTRIGEQEQAYFGGPNDPGNYHFEVRDNWVYTLRSTLDPSGYSSPSVPVRVNIDTHETEVLS
ncbi:MAG: hypothetical protein LBR98_02900 [Syntrophomonadaceae bacterium]|jgi:hypothetical protein|nr:hypothetical protein [Syntrophomonadaceae bacterium]